MDQDDILESAGTASRPIEVRAQQGIWATLLRQLAIDMPDCFLASSYAVYCSSSIELATWRHLQGTIHLEYHWAQVGVLRKLEAFLTDIVIRIHSQRLTLSSHRKCILSMQ
jgi:hypothetical protein